MVLKSKLYGYFYVKRCHCWFEFVLMQPKKARRYILRRAVLHNVL